MAVAVHQHLMIQLLTGTMNGTSVVLHENPARQMLACYTKQPGEPCGIEL